MKIVLLDGKTLGDDLDLTIFNALGDVTTYKFTHVDEVVDRIKDVDVVITNKVTLGAHNLKDTQVKLICVTATGTNNIDLEYCKNNGIGVCNVAGYSTDSVAQHTFAMLFYLLEHLNYYDAYVKKGHYVDDEMFTHFARKFYQVKDKTWGIIGLGAIGRRVAEIATVFGAKVKYYSTSGRNNDQPYEQVDLDTLLKESDILSIHAPLNENTKNLIGYDELVKMKESSILLNLGRGTIVNEEDLVRALNENQIQAAGLDVLEHEPMNQGNVLLEIQDSSKLLVTPHIAWASKEARETVIAEVYANIETFFNGGKRNRVA